jgi:hypothetical protein
MIIIDIESQEVMTTISMETDIYGMAVRGRTIYYCTVNKGLKMLNLSDKSTSDVIKSKYSSVYYVSTSGDKLCILLRVTNKSVYVSIAYKSKYK